MQTLTHTIGLQDLLDRARAQVEAMSPAEREAMYQVQRESWVRGEMALGLDRPAPPPPDSRFLTRGPFPVEPGQRLILRNKSGTIVAVVDFDDNAMLQAGGTVRTAAWVRHDIVDAWRDVSGEAPAGA